MNDDTQELGVFLKNHVGVVSEEEQAEIDSHGIDYDDLSGRELLLFGALSKEEQNREIQKGLDDLKRGNLYSLEDIENILKEKFGTDL